MPCLSQSIASAKQRIWQRLFLPPPAAHALQQHCSSTDVPPAEVALTPPCQPVRSSLINRTTAFLASLNHTFSPTQQSNTTRSSQCALPSVLSTSPDLNLRYCGLHPSHTATATSCAAWRPPSVLVPTSGAVNRSATDGAPWLQPRLYSAPTQA